jgi:hypothetical protein
MPAVPWTWLSGRWWVQSDLVFHLVGCFVDSQDPPQQDGAQSDWTVEELGRDQRGRGGISPPWHFVRSANLKCEPNLSTSVVPRPWRRSPFRQLRHLLSNETYEWVDDGVGPVRVGRSDGSETRFDVDGWHLSGVRRSADRAMCRWIACGGPKRLSIERRKRHGDGVQTDTPARDRVFGQ